MRLKVKKAKQVRSIAKIETNKGTFALKKVGYQPQNLHFIYEAQEHLWKNGFQYQPRWLVTNSGLPFVQSPDENFYFLNTWINGKESDVKNYKQLKEIMRLQANLHQYSQGFTPSHNAMIKTKWDQWDMKYESYVRKFKNQFNEVKLQPESPFGYVFLETAEGFIEMAEEGKELFHTSTYPEVLNQAIAQRDSYTVTLPTTMYLFKNQNMNVIDFDYCSQNLRINRFGPFCKM